MPISLPDYDPETLVSVAEVAELLGYHRQTLWRAYAESEDLDRPMPLVGARRAKGPGSTIGWRWRQVLEWLRRRERRAQRPRRARLPRASRRDAA